jgi:hypothetical protein
MPADPHRPNTKKLANPTAPNKKVQPCLSHGCTPREALYSLGLRRMAASRGSAVVLGVFPGPFLLVNPNRFRRRAVIQTQTGSRSFELARGPKNGKVAGSGRCLVHVRPVRRAVHSWRNGAANAQGAREPFGTSRDGSGNEALTTLIRYRADRLRGSSAARHARRAARAAMPAASPAGRRATGSPRAVARDARSSPSRS